MKNRFAEMDCFVLAGGRHNPVRDFQPVGDLTRLEQGYRRYAAVFENVRLVLKKDQATERYLNYPHVCDERSESGPVIGVKTALGQARSEAVFIGSTEITNFPLELAAKLVRQYDGELFLGYCSSERPTGSRPLFGVFHTRLLDRLTETGPESLEFFELLGREGRLVPLPPDISADHFEYI